MTINLPLMDNNITSHDLDILINFLKSRPRLTQHMNVEMFEKEWSEWLGVNHSVFVNSGASANFITIAALKHLYGTGEVIVPPLTWVSDIVSVIMNDMQPVFADINPKNLCMDDKLIVKKITKRTKAVFLTHIQGFNGLTSKLLDELKSRGIHLIEDACESHGATFEGKKVGSFGLVSNFSFYYAHHMSTIEGGMICTNDETFYNVVLMLRSHGMVREARSTQFRKEWINRNKDLNPDFIFAFPALNHRGTEIGGVLGRSQLKNLDANNKRRSENFQMFLNNLDDSKYRTDFSVDGSSNYAFPLVIKNPDFKFRDRLEKVFNLEKIEFRRGSSGGGNQLRQPYLQSILPANAYRDYPETEHIHHFGYYIGNYPTLEKTKISALLRVLNDMI